MSVNAKKLNECLKRGGALLGKGIDTQAIKREAQERNLVLFEVDCSRAKTKSAVLRSIANTVDFPEYFGGNLDALYDCLCDTVLDQKTGMVLVLRQLHEDDPGLAGHAQAVLQVGTDVAEFARENGRIFTFIVDKADGAAEPDKPLSTTSL